MQEKRPGIFYGWWIVAAGVVSGAFGSMTYGYGLSLFYKTLIDHFGWTRAQLAGAVSLSRLESGVMGGIEGFLVDRYGPRIIIFFGTLLMTAGFILLSRINSLFQFYLIFISMVTVGMSLSRQIPVDVTVANWFIRRRGTAFGLLRGSVAIGASGVVVLAWFIAQFGWRTAFVATGVGTFMLGIPVAFIMRRRPEIYGLLPDGDVKKEATPEAFHVEGAGDSSSVADIGMTVREALTSWPFWALASGFAIRLAVTGAVTLHAIPLIEDMGYSRAAAAGVLGSIGMVSLIGRLGGGILNDLVGTKRVAVGSILTLAISFLIIAQAQTMWQVMVFVAIYAPSYGCSAATLPAIKGDYFGRRSFGAIFGLSGLVQMVGAMIGPVFAAWVYDTTGSYRVAFLIFAGVLMGSAALFLSLKPPRYH